MPYPARFQFSIVFGKQGRDSKCMERNRRNTAKQKLDVCRLTGTSFETAEKIVDSGPRIRSGASFAGMTKSRGFAKLSTPIYTSNTKLRSSWAGMRPHEKIGRRTTHAG